MLACGGLRAAPKGSAATETMIARAGQLGPAALATEQAGAVFGPEYRAEHPDAVRDFIRWRAAMDQVSLQHAFRAPFGRDHESCLPDLTAPVSVIAADTDTFLPLASSQTLAMRAGAPLHVIMGSGHMAPVECPDDFTTALLQAIGDMMP